jgi:hypothetical protein
MGGFVFIRFEFCSIFVNFLPLAMVMSFLNGAAEALVPKECLTCLGHGPGDATSQSLVTIVFPTATWDFGGYSPFSDTATPHHPLEMEVLRWC